MSIIPFSHHVRAEANDVKNTAIHCYQTPWYVTQVQTRVTSTLLIPLDVLTSLFDTCIGVTAAAINLGLTLGMHERSYQVAEVYLHSSNALLAGPFGHLVQVINPKIDSYNKSERAENTTGIVHRHVTAKLFGYAKAKSKEDGFFSKHVVSRFVYGVATISSPFTRLIDLVIGVVVAPFALLVVLLGEGKEICAFTCKQLKVGGVVEDVVLGIIHTINPWAGPPPKEQKQD